MNDATRTIASNDGWSIPADNGVGRRTLIQGAAWAIPVIAVATATPAFAATFKCPTTPPSSSWNGPTGFNGDTSGGGYYRWTNDTDGDWVNTKDATRSGSLEYYVEFTMDVESGHNYTFNWSAFANGADNNASYVAYDVSIGGSKVYTASTDGSGGGNSAYLDPNSGASVSASYTYNATTTGTITFRYTIRLSQLNATQTSNHNVQIKKPTITCS